MKSFFTIKDQCVSAELVEKKSKFIANLFFVDNVAEAENIIKNVKKKYFDARHNCFAYIISESGNIVKKCSDDGEPSKTAGAPMLEILEKQRLCNVLIIVTRYFGGILLGTGGLVRAYSGALIKAIQSSTIVEKVPGYIANIKLSYPNFERFKFYCDKNNINIINSDYSDFILCKIELDEIAKNNLEREINEQNNMNILEFDIIDHTYISVCTFE